MIRLFKNIQNINVIFFESILLWIFFDVSDFCPVGRPSHDLNPTSEPVASQFLSKLLDILQVVSPVRTIFTVSPAGKHHQIIMLMPLCLIVGIKFSSDAVLGVRWTCHLSLLTKISTLVSSDHKTFCQKVSSLLI